MGQVGSWYPFAASMRVVVTNLGSTGDVRPLVVLATGLARRGHQVTAAFPPNFEWLARGRGIDFAAVGPAVIFAVSPEIVDRTGWPSHWHAAGFLLDLDDYQPTSALQRFFAAGEPPVLIFFGSCLQEGRDQLLQTAIEAALSVGCRVIA